jgi:hypothetical protein
VAPGVEAVAPGAEPPAPEAEPPGPIDVAGPEETEPGSMSAGEPTAGESSIGGPAAGEPSVDWPSAGPDDEDPDRTQTIIMPPIRPSEPGDEPR